MLYDLVQHHSFLDKTLVLIVRGKSNEDAKYASAFFCFLIYLPFKSASLQQPPAEGLHGLCCINTCVLIHFCSQGK